MLLVLSIWNGKRVSDMNQIKTWEIEKNGVYEIDSEEREIDPVLIWDHVEE